MKITVLLDNNTLIDRYFLGEPGVSYLVEADGKKILFDVGYSDAYIKNAQKMNINLLDVDYIVLSHGHLDHTWGLDPYLKLLTEAIIEKIKYRKPAIVTHPLTFNTKKAADLAEIGSIVSGKKLSEHFELKLSRQPVWLTDNLVYLGKIERLNDFEAKRPVGKVIINNEEKDDFLEEDSAMAYKTSKGLVIITGCSHAGICNITQYAKKVCNDDRILDIIGGFHLLNPSAEQINGTVDYLKKTNPTVLHACHCTDLNSKIVLSKACNMKEAGVGLKLEYL